MVTKLDVFLTVSLYPGLSVTEIVKKIGKKQITYNAVLKHSITLREECLITESDGHFSVEKNKKSQGLFNLVYFCFKNNIDYNKIVSQKAAEFVKIGLEKGIINGLLFDAKTVRRIIAPFSRNGFAIIETKKPFVCRIVPSQFTNDLVTYYFGEVKPAYKNIVDCLEEYQVNLKLQKSYSEYKKLEKEKLSFDEIRFIHTSLSLEGNTLTLSETEKLIKQNIAPTTKLFKDAQQVIDYKKALDNFIYSIEGITESAVLEFHQTAMHTLTVGAGVFRTENVKIKGNPNFKTPDWKELPKLLCEFFKKTVLDKKEKLTAVEIVERASFLHKEFQRIHPFIDGNSRTSRAILLKALTQYRFPLLQIPVGFSDAYLQQTKMSEKRDDEKFALLMKQIALENLKQIITRIEFN